MQSRILLACLLALAVAGPARGGDCVRDPYGNVVCGKGQCATDQYGKVLCAKEGGGAMRDPNGDVKCGFGLLRGGRQRSVRCSTQPGGGATTDSDGKVKCLGGCRARLAAIVRNRALMRYVADRAAG